MPVYLDAIIPKRAIVPTPAGIQRRVDRALRDFAFGTVNRMQEYPAWRPWKRPPRTGPHAGGRRTGDYGRGWARKITFLPDRVTIVNPVVYSAYVGGPTRKSGGVTQARALRARGWKSISDVAPALRKQYRPVFIRALTGL